MVDSARSTDGMVGKCLRRRADDMGIRKRGTWQKEPMGRVASEAFGICLCLSLGDFFHHC